MTFEQMERAMEFMLEQQARSLEHQAQTDARFKETGEILNRVGLKLDIVAADAVAFDARMDKLHDEIASVRDIAIAHNQAIHQLFKLHEQTQQKFDRLHEQTVQKFDRLHEQRKDEFELNQQNFEILNEQRERDMEETRKKAELADEQREKDVRALYDLIKQLTRKIDSLTDAITRQNRNGNQ